MLALIGTGAPRDPVTTVVAIAIATLLIGGFLWYYLRRERREYKLRREQRSRERRFQERRAEEKLEAWADDADEEPCCGVCRGKLGDDPTACPSCSRQFHARCWETNDGCNQCGYKVSVME